MSSHFFTFGFGNPYRNCYVEVEIPDDDPRLTTRHPTALAREAMVEAHGVKFAFQYDSEPDFARQIEEHGLKRLSLLRPGGIAGRWIAVDVLGSE